MKDRINTILSEISKGIYEKEEVIKFALLSALSGQSIFLLGPPGVAKSLIARRLKHVFKGSSSFEYLMNRFSTPDEIFGPINIKELKAGKYVRITKGFLPQSEIVFLDEIWKAGPSIQNTLLTVLNEKRFRNGEQDEKVKLKALIAASNELPASNEGLEALWDRFILRYNVSGIESKDNFDNMISEQDDNELQIEVVNPIDDEDFQEIKKGIDKIEIPSEIFDIINTIRVYVKERNQKGGDSIYISDRRWKKTTQILKTSAFLNDRAKVDLMDCYLIAFCIWDKPTQIEDLREIVAKSIKEFGYNPLTDLSEIKNEVSRFKDEVNGEIHEDYEEKVVNAENEEIKTETKKRLKSKLNLVIKNHFNEKIEGVIAKINTEDKKIEDYLKNDLSEIRTNLFVPEVLADNVESKINEIKAELRKIEIEVNKIKSSYVEIG
jgi:MoxR-like ATPase